MLLTPYNITRAIIMLVCAIGVFTFVFIWALSPRSAQETSFYLIVIAAFALGAVSPYSAGAWLGRMIMTLSLFAPVLGVFIFNANGADLTVNKLWPAILLGAIMSKPVWIERAIGFGLDMHRRVAR